MSILRGRFWWFLFLYKNICDGAKKLEKKFFYGKNRRQKSRKYVPIV
jgi:hypothetical protein